MCFSPQVDVAAGVVVGSIGFDAWRHVARPAERPLAAVPLVLAAHQLVESVVWWGLQGHVPRSVWHPAAVIYLAIAFGVLPVLVPVAVLALEPSGRRRRLFGLAAVASAVGVVLMYAVVRGPVVAKIQGHHIAYHVGLWHGGVTVGVYVAATCGAMLISRDRTVRYFGIVNLGAVLLLAWLSQSGLISLWCAWAAVTSLAIATHLRSPQNRSRRPEAGEYSARVR